MVLKGCLLVPFSFTKETTWNEKVYAARHLHARNTFAENFTMSNNWVCAWIHITSQSNKYQQLTFHVNRYFHFLTLSYIILGRTAVNSRIGPANGVELDVVFDVIDTGVAGFPPYDVGFGIGVSPASQDEGHHLNDFFFGFALQADFGWIW